MAAKKNQGKKAQGKKRTNTTRKQTTTKRSSGRRTTNVRTKKKQTSPLMREIIFLVLLVFGILSLLSLFQMCGVFGEGLSALLFGLFGALAYVFPFYLIVTAGLYIANANNQPLRRKIWYSVGIYWSLCGLFQWVVNDPVQNVWQVYTVCAENKGGGGFFGGVLAFELASVLGRAGAFIVLLALFILFFMLISGKLFFASLRQLYRDREDDKEDYIYEDDVPDVPFSGRHQMNTYKFEAEKKQVDLKSKQTGKRAKKQEK